MHASSHNAPYAAAPGLAEEAIAMLATRALRACTSTRSVDFGATAARETTLFLCGRWGRRLTCRRFGTDRGIALDGAVDDTWIGGVTDDGSVVAGGR
jgi:hypothetical protein